MTLPSLTSYGRSLLRYWYVLVIAAGLTMGLAQPRSPSPDTSSLVTTGDVLFTIAVDDAGQESDGSARIAEDSLASARLESYADLVRRSTSVQRILLEAEIRVSPLDLLSSSKQAGRLEILTRPAGVVVVRLANENMDPSEARKVVSAIQSEVAATATELDALQESPSIVGRPVVANPQTSEGVLVVGTPSWLTAYALPAVVGLMIGLVLVYLLDWRYRRVENRQDLEDRLQVGVLGEVYGRPADSEVLARALARHANGGHLVVLAGAQGSADLMGLSASVIRASPAVGVQSTLVPQGAPLDGPSPDSVDAEPTAPGGTALRIVDLSDPRGVNAELVARSPSADLVAIYVEYGRTPLRDLESMLIRLTDVSDTPLRVVGVGRRA